MRRRRILSGLVILAAALGSVPVAAQSPGPTTSPPIAPVPFCKDVPEVAIPDERFGDTPVYVGNEQPTDELQEWGRRQPGYQDLWIDRDHLGWVVLAFDGEAAARQAELEREFPGVGAVAIEVDWTTDELVRLHERASLMGDPVRSAGTDIVRGVVAIGVGVLDPAKVAEIEREFGGERVCIDGIDPATLPAPGPQPRAGDGWRLLGHAKAGAPYRTGIAADRQSFRALWKRARMPGKPPAVDFEQQVAIWFGAVYGTSCPKIRLDDVVVGPDAPLVHPLIVQTRPEMDCTTDANGHAYLVALDRDRLPAPPFRIQLQAGDPPPGAEREITLVRADLRVPGSVPGAGEVRTVRPPQEYGLRSGGVMETCCPGAYQLDASCGAEWLGQLNGIWWRTGPPAGATEWLPEAWRPSVDADGMLEVTVTLREAADPVITDGRPRAEATLNGETVLYHATMDAPPPCTEPPSPVPSG